MSNEQQQQQQRGTEPNLDVTNLNLLNISPPN